MVLVRPKLSVGKNWWVLVANICHFFAPDCLPSLFTIHFTIELQSGSRVKWVTIVRSRTFFSVLGIF